MKQILTAAAVGEYRTDADIYIVSDLRRRE